MHDLLKALALAPQEGSFWKTWTMLCQERQDGTPLEAGMRCAIPQQRETGRMSTVRHRHIMRDELTFTCTKGGTRKSLDRGQWRTGRKEEICQFAFHTKGRL
jgi:hypothetical protein